MDLITATEFASLRQYGCVGLILVYILHSFFDGFDQALHHNPSFSITMMLVQMDIYHDCMSIIPWYDKFVYFLRFSSQLELETQQW